MDAESNRGGVTVTETAIPVSGPDELVADLAAVPLSGRISADLLHEEEVDLSAENAGTLVCFPCADSCDCGAFGFQR
jgi:hypothetical protein